MAAISKGAAGEVAAARFLRSKGYTLLSTGYRCRLGELDIVAEKDGYAVFVEVKTRQEDSMYLPRESVNLAKQRRIIRTASLYLAQAHLDLQPRFDVVEVRMDPAYPMKVTEINHIIGAFEADDLTYAF